MFQIFISIALSIVPMSIYFFYFKKTSKWYERNGDDNLVFLDIALLFGIPIAFYYIFENAISHQQFFIVGCVLQYVLFCLRIEKKKKDLMTNQKIKKPKKEKVRVVDSKSKEYNQTPHLARKKRLKEIQKRL